MKNNEEFIEMLRNKSRELMKIRHEYHLFCAGKIHRIGRIEFRDLIPLIGEWIEELFANGCKFETPIYVFSDGNLLEYLEFKHRESSGDIQFFVFTIKSDGEDDELVFQLNQRNE